MIGFQRSLYQQRQIHGLILTPRKILFESSKFGGFARSLLGQVAEPDMCAHPSESCNGLPYPFPSVSYSELQMWVHHQGVYSRGFLSNCQLPFCHLLYCCIMFCM